ncbi:retrotransposon hot spot (RHS) protein, putative [Trypanosoma cruzi]|nr:retrotransposon hot spot (RHS) protein, putative [Trypanosoma cruzi]
MSGRPEEGLYGNVESQSSNFSQGRRRRTRSEFEGDTDYSSNTRIRLEGMYRPQWTMSSSVEDILLEGSTNRTDMKLNDFLRSNLGGRGVVDTNENVAMQAFVLRPTMFINDSEILGIITKLPSYRELKMELKRELNERKILLEAIYKLHHEGVYSLRQWNEYKRKDTLNTLAKGKLNRVITDIEIEEKERREEEERARREEKARRDAEEEKARREAVEIAKRENEKLIREAEARVKQEAEERVKRRRGRNEITCPLISKMCFSRRSPRQGHKAE